MFKTLDKKVLLLLCLGTYLRMFVLLFCSGVSGASGFVLYAPMIFGVAVFFMFLADNRYSWKYYIIYILLITFLRVAVEGLMPLVISSLRYSNLAFTKVFFIGYTLQFLLAFLSAWLFGTFKEMSYKKHLN